MEHTRILIADDNQRVRCGVRALLSSDLSYEICGEAADGTEALRVARELLPDLILLDISMPGLSGLEVARLVRQQLPKTKILVMSQHDTAQLLPHVLEAGAHACVDKSRLGTDLLLSIRNMPEIPQARQASNSTSTTASNTI
jgi:DNA-binding NarL/FixJ family response regulator